MEQHDIGEGRAIADHDAPGLGAAARLVVPHHLDLQRDDAAGPGLGELGPLTPVDIAVGHMQQQVAERGSADEPRRATRRGSGLCPEGWSAARGLHATGSVVTG